MFLYQNKTKIFFLLMLLFILVACSEPGTKIAGLFEDTFSEKNEKTCPKVKFIEGMDKIKFKEESKNIYEVNFFEVKWKCYSYNTPNKQDIDNNIELDIKFKIDYEDNIKVFKVEKFSFVLALLNEKNEVIIKNKFDRSFLNKENSEILNNQNGIINIKLKDNNKDISQYLLLLGLIQ